MTARKSKRTQSLRLGYAPSGWVAGKLYIAQPVVAYWKILLRIKKTSQNKFDLVPLFVNFAQ